ncbi:MAG TPA: PhoH family protein [Bacteroidales bacterium]|nr:PhoH family protein [Bacteroidales bacterium]HRZ77221.1 PhoH family protein [Bacteroidales bacterium]
MTEKTISLTSYNPLDIYGVNDTKLETIRAAFPKLRIVARGEMLKIIGEDKDIATFERKLDLMLMQYDEFGKLTVKEVEQILESEDAFYQRPEGGSNGDVLVHGRHGMMVKARTINQHRMVEGSQENDLVFAIGPAGTGKTYTAVALAVRALKNREVKRIILTRPAVEAGENLGFLPGDLRDKLDPYLQPLYDALKDMLPTQKLLTYMEDGTIEIAPLAFMRGRTLDHAFVILDEAQNATVSQLKMFLTRMGKSAKFVVTGDITQIDLPRNQPSGLVHAMRILQDIKGIEIISLDDRDIIRHPLVSRVIKAYEEERG